MSRLRDQLIQIQKRNYRKNLRLIREYLADEPAIERYEREYRRALRKYSDISSKAELLKNVLSANIVYHGDYHTLKQSQRSVLRILREIENRRQVLLCLEMFFAEHQKYLDSYLAGRMPEKAFLKRIGYSRHWPFPWEHWRPVLHLCRQHGIPVLGINVRTESGNPLRERDRFSARLLTRTVIRNPEKLVYVVDGEYHICPTHLPGKVARLLRLVDVKIRDIIIYQNAENLYWKLCREGKEETDVLRVSDNSFCIMNTMPANKIQSFLNWLEFSRDSYYPVHHEWETEGFEGMGLTVPNIVTSLCQILGLDIPEGSLRKLMIFYASNLRFLDIIHEQPELKGQLDRVKEKIKREEGFLIEYGCEGEEAFLIYLANSNLNMAAEEAAHFLNAVLRGRLQKPLKAFDSFYRNVLTECLGFFGSKFINEKRKTQSEHSLRQYLGRVRQQGLPSRETETAEVARCVLQHYYLQRKDAGPEEFTRKFRSYYRSRSGIAAVFSTQLGYILGNKLYFAVKKGQFPLGAVRRYFAAPFDKPLEAFSCYREITNRLKNLKTAPHS